MSDQDKALAELRDRQLAELHRLFSVAALARKLYVRVATSPEFDGSDEDYAEFAFDMAETFVSVEEKRAAILETKHAQQTKDLKGGDP